jgi:Haemolysin-type calcium binding protein related domain.
LHQDFPGGSGDDIYWINSGSGNDQIIESSGVDRIAFGLGIESSNVVASRSNGEVTLAFASGDSIRFADYGNGSYAIEEFQFADGVFGAVWLNSLLGVGLAVSDLNTAQTKCNPVYTTAFDDLIIAASAVDPINIIARPTWKILMQAPPVTAS